MKVLALGYSSVFERRVLPALLSSGMLSLLGLATRSRVKKLAEIKLSDPPLIFFNDYEAALKAVEWDLVYISLPNHLHFFWAKKAIELELDTIIEKPAVLTKEEGELLSNLAFKKNILLAESIVWTSHARVSALKAEIDKVKTPLQLHAVFHVPQFSPDNFRNFTRYGGGVINDMGPYAISIISLLLERELKNICINKKRGQRVILELTSDCNDCLIFDMAFGRKYRNTLSIIGENQRFDMDRVFSPPANEAFRLSVSCDCDANTKENYFCDDVYKNFFLNIVMNKNIQKEKERWNTLLLSNAASLDYIKQLAREVI